jgi:DNA (cytosine-5)-methyltransferase 1
VEIEPYCRAVIKQHYPEEILHDDIRTYSAHHLRGVVDGICGGFPCQDISSAGKGAGITGENSGLWKEFARVIGEARPSWAFIENSPLLRSRGLEVVLEDLATLGYDAEWGTYRASDVGAPHRRDRMWILAYIRNSEQVSRNGRGGEQRGRSAIPSVGGQRCYVVCGGTEYNEGGDPSQESSIVAHRATDRMGAEKWSKLQRSLQWWVSEPDMGRVVDGVADRVDRLAALGNGWVPLQAAEAFKQLWNRIDK